jgi:hypothetical protein
MFSVDRPVSVSATLTVDQSGRLALSEDQLFSLFVGLPADRIRSCAICTKLFWARRTNSECCGQTCRKTFNQRNSRRAARELRLGQKSSTRKPARSRAPGSQK